MVQLSSLLALVAGLTAAVLIGATIRLARRRRAVSLSIAASVAFGLFTLLSLSRGRVPVWSETLRVDASEQLGPQLRGELARPLWWLVPRGRLRLELAAEALAQPLEGVDELVAVALERGVQVDVHPHGEAGDEAVSGKSSLEDAAVALIWRQDGTQRELPADTRFPLIGASDVEVRLRGAAPGESECRFDGLARVGAGAGTDSSLDELVARALDPEPGWHRIECSVGERTAVRHVELSGRGVVVASADPPDMSWADEQHDPRDHGIQLPWFTRDPEEMAEAQMLIVDEGMSARACEAAQEVLGRGGSVILAMPEAQTCPELVPEALTRRLVDRRPRFTFVDDPTFDALELEPSCVAEEGRGLVCDGHLRDPPESMPKRQQAWIEDACSSALLKVSGREGSCASSLREGYEQQVAVSLRREPPALTDERELLSAMEIERAIAQFDQQWQEMDPRERATVRDNHVVWMLSADPAAARDPNEFHALLEKTGARVEVVRVNDPYARTLRVLHPAAAGLPPMLGRLVSDPAGRVRRSPGSCEVRRCVVPLDPAVWTQLSPESDAQARVEGLHAGRFLSPNTATLVPEGASPLAPIRFWLWDSSSLHRAAQTSNFLPFGSLLATRGPEGLAQRSLALGTMVGRGHLLLLSYSPFEFQAESKEGGVPLAAGSELRWKGSRGAGVSEVLGHDPIRAFHRATRSFSSSVGIGRVEELPGGVLELEVHRSLTTPAPDLLSLGFKGGHRGRARLVHFDFSRGSFRYRIELARLFEAGGRSCEMLTPDVVGSSPIMVCPPAREREQLVLPGRAALEALARYSGGCYGAEDCGGPPVGRSRSSWALLASLCFAGLWGHRLLRRGRARAWREQLRIKESHAQRRYDPPAAVVAAAGEWGARSTTWSRTGAFGGFRPLEPGDRVSAMVTDDLITLSRGQRSVLPRMALRIEEAAPKLRVLINLGPSMRQPMGEHAASKILLAAQLAELVAAHVWQGRGSASIHALGLDAELPVVAETTHQPARGEIERALVELARRRPSPCLRPPRAPDVGALVYISDFQYEDLDAFSDWLVEAEASGVRIAALMVYSEVELTMVEAGRLAHSTQFVDRAGWSARDLTRQLRLRTDHVERVFESASGGLCIAETSMSTQDLELILEERRVLEVLR